MNQHIRTCLLHNGAVKALASLRHCAVSTEPSSLSHTHTSEVDEGLDQTLGR